MQQNLIERLNYAIEFDWEGCLWYLTEKIAAAIKLSYVHGTKRMFPTELCHFPDFSTRDIHRSAHIQHLDLNRCVADPDPSDPYRYVSGLLDPYLDPLVRGVDPYPDPSIIKEK